MGDTLLSHAAMIVLVSGKNYSPSFVVYDHYALYITSALFTVTRSFFPVCDVSSITTDTGLNG